MNTRPLITHLPPSQALAWVAITVGSGKSLLFEYDDGMLYLELLSRGRIARETYEHGYEAGSTLLIEALHQMDIKVQFIPEARVRAARRDPDVPLSPETDPEQALLDLGAPTPSTHY